jgi:hypothetical protein
MVRGVFPTVSDRFHPYLNYSKSFSSELAALGRELAAKTFEILQQLQKVFFYEIRPNTLYFRYRREYITKGTGFFPQRSPMLFCFCSRVLFAGCLRSVVHETGATAVEKVWQRAKTFKILQQLQNVFFYEIRPNIGTTLFSLPEGVYYKSNT